MKRQYDERLALAVASGLSVEQAAAQLGISRRTAFRRWRDPTIKKRAAELRCEITDRAIGKLVETLHEAVLTLRQLMASAESEAVKLKAATALLDTGLKASVIAELERRIVELETALKARGQ